METGAITAQIDVAQIVLYAFWIFFVGLVLYLRREDKREGYPLASDRSGRIDVHGFPRTPAPKTFRLDDGSMRQAPRAETEPDVRAAPVGPWPGAPLVPTGNPLVDGVGPAAATLRADVPDTVLDGSPRIVPMRAAPEFSLERRDPDLRGMTVLGADGTTAGDVADLWVDRVEPQIRYVEVSLAGGARTALVPIHYVAIDRYRRTVRVDAILARQFADAPRLARPDAVTMREEDRIGAYYAGGLLYAEPGRAEPLL
jgi:photosynthetic reaction center H subunit